MAMMKMKIVILLITALGLAAGAGAIACQAFASKPAPDKPPAAKPPADPPQKNEPQVRLDDDGDPLPDGAVRRVGTLRFRQGGGQFNSLLIPPDGKTLVAGDFYGDRTICSWDLATGKLLRSFPGSWWNVRIALSPSGTTVAGALGNDAVGLWDLATGKETRRLECKGHCPEGFAFSPDGKTLAVGGTGGFIDFWDLTTGKRTERRKTALNRVTLLAFTPDGKTLASGDWAEDTITLWDAASGKEIRRLTRPGEVWNIVISPDGAFLASLGMKRRELELLRLWEISTGKLIYEVPTIGQTGGVAFSPDGKTLASAEFDDQHAVIVLRDVKSGKVRLSHPIPQFAECLAYSADGKTLISGCICGVIRLWDAETGEERIPTGGRWWNGNAVLSPDGRTLAYAERNIRFWDMESGREAGLLPASEDGNTSLTFAPDGKSLASVGVNAIFFWDIGTRKLVRRIDRDVTQTRNWFELAAFSPDGKTLAAAEYDGLIRLWDPASGKELRQCKFQKDVEEKQGRTASGLAFSPDGRTLAASGHPSGVSSNRVRLWDMAATERIPPLLWEVETPYEGNYSPSGSTWLGNASPKVVFSPDGHMLSMNRYQKTIPVWEAVTGKQRLLLTGHTESTCCVAFAPDSRTLASSGYDDTIRLWNMETGEELRTLKGHRGKANSLVFSADGKTLVSTGDDTTMLFWDVAEVTRRPRPKASRLSSEECKSLWADLAGADAAKAYKAIRAFSAAPGQTVSFLGERLRPARSAGKEEVDRLLADLDSDDFQIRDKATGELDELGDTVGPALRKVIAGQPSAEVRARVNRLLEKLATPAPELLRNLRALEVLEAVGGPEALQVVERIANGAAEARLTRDAKAALARIGVSRQH
jgi:WD40 repeat protein